MITFILILTLVALMAASAAAGAEVSASESACLDSCGSITNISFPFSASNNLTSCSSSYMNNPYLHLLCNQTEGKLYALPDPVYTDPESQLTRLEVISIRNDSLIVRIADNDMDVAQITPLVRDDMTLDDFNCTNSKRTWALLPPAGLGPYVISEENKFGGFGCTVGVIRTSDITDRTLNDPFVDYYDHVVVGGCSVLFPDNEHNMECRNHTCCVESLPPSSDLHLRYASYTATLSDSMNLFGINLTDPECMCSKSYATLFHPEFTDFDRRSFRVKIMWALPVVLNGSADPTSIVTENELNRTITESPHYACTRDKTSEFIPVPEVPGYRCKCKDGFKGDGYTNGTGCASKQNTIISHHPFNYI